MSKFKEIDLDKIKTISIKSRKNKVTSDDFATITNAKSFPAFWDSLPNILAAGDIKNVVKAVQAARKKNKPVIWLMGAHVIKVGLSPIVIDMMKRGFITAVGLNGAGAIHDTETAMIGATSEEVGDNISDGTFGMVEETSTFINSSVNAGVLEAKGFGEALGENIVSAKLPYADQSILAAGSRLGIPVTVHVAHGTDIVHVHPSFDGACTGEATHRDFRIMAHQISSIGGGGVIFVVGSSVILPLIVEKSLAVATNQGKNIEKFTGVNLDFIRHYRPHLNPVKRAFEHSGEGISITGHHELIVPMIYWALRHT